MSPPPQPRHVAAGARRPRRRHARDRSGNGRAARPSPGTDRRHAPLLRRCDAAPGWLAVGRAASEGAATSTPTGRARTAGECHRRGVPCPGPARRDASGADLGRRARTQRSGDHRHPAQDDHRLAGRPPIDIDGHRTVDAVIELSHARAHPDRRRRARRNPTENAACAACAAERCLATPSSCRASQAARRSTAGHAWRPRPCCALAGGSSSIARRAGQGASPIRGCGPTTCR
jgi:hypothetical protein